MDCSMPGLSVYRHLLEFSQTHVHWVGNAIQPSHPLSSPSPPAFNLSQNQGLFKWVSSSYQVAKYWSFSLNISPSNEHPGLISFRMDWLDLLEVQGTLKSLLQHHSSKAWILQCSAFFIVQLSHPYMTTGKTIALTRRIFGVILNNLCCDFKQNCFLALSDSSSLVYRIGIEFCISVLHPSSLLNSLISSKSFRLRL